MKAAPTKDISVRARGGRAAARGASQRIKAGGMHDRLIDGLDKRKPKSSRQPTKSELFHMVSQAHQACENHPDSPAAQRRFVALSKLYNHLYGGK